MSGARDPSETNGSGRPSLSPFLRAFVAVKLPEPVRAALSDVQQRLKACGAPVSWVPPANFHLSLAFLGDITPDQVAGVAAAIDAAARAGSPCTAPVERLGTFGSRRNPRVVWAGINAPAELLELQRHVAAGIVALGIRLEERAFRPHITLGRIRPGRPCTGLVDAIQAEQAAVFGSLPVHRLCLMQSILAPTGATYRALHAADLGR